MCLKWLQVFVCVCYYIQRDTVKTVNVHGDGEQLQKISSMKHLQFLQPLSLSVRLTLLQLLGHKHVSSVKFKKVWNNLHGQRVKIDFNVIFLVFKVFLVQTNLSSN